LAEERHRFIELYLTQFYSEVGEWFLRKLQKIDLLKAWK
jgi:hypothetical protein